MKLKFVEKIKSKVFNRCAAELFVSILHPFEAGIANAISSFK